MEQGPPLNGDCFSTEEPGARSARESKSTLHPPPNIDTNLKQPWHYPEFVVLSIRTGFTLIFFRSFKIHINQQVTAWPIFLVKKPKID